MAPKNQVTLTFAGDSKNLEQSFDKVGASSRKMETDVDNQAKKLDRLGESGGRTETTFLGLGAGISGVSSIMSGDAGPEQYAMALADLGDSVEHTVVPAMQSGVKAVKGMNLAMAASLVGLAALAAGAVYLAFTQKSTVIDVDALTEALTSQDDAVKRNTQNQIGFFDAWGHLDSVFDEVLAKSPQLAEEFIAQSEAAGVDSDALAEMREKLGEVAETTSFAADQIRGFNDALRAQTDPVFAVIDAQNQMATAAQGVAEAQAASTAAAAEFGVNSPQHLAALEAERLAQVAVAEAGIGHEGALLSLGESMVRSGTKIDDVIAHLQGMVGQNGITQASVDAVSWSLRHVPSQVDSTVNVRVNREALDRLLSTNTFGLFQANVPQFHSGGVMPGAPGSEGLALLQAGEHITPAGQGGGGNTYNLYVQGSIRSDRDLVKLVRDEFGRGGFR